ncbi:hypothetical protein RJ640_023035 [Escallonia rubra]|uniref:Uncharacterized protein n=1 Tax=Escallonia rubra TaxID=112253 RepID=A0AA88RQ72_9ASTE|nr:hypothetical protein RJ640_023035 [Escallonia rubra]
MDDFTWVSHLKSLQRLDLNGVSLIRAQNAIKVLSKLPSILSLSLRACGLGNIHLSHAYVNSTLSNVQYLDLSYNSFEGELPYLFENMTSLRVLDLKFNSFSSSIPMFLGNLTSLVDLTLADNKFVSIEGYNEFNGHLPDWLGLFTGLKELDLKYNSFNGSVPVQLGRLSALTVSLTLQVKPEWVPPFQLKKIGMKSCNIGPQFPQWLRTQKEVESLDFSSGSISGAPPKWVGDMPLSDLDLSHKSISGSFPNLPSSVIGLGLSHNLFSGPLPRDIGDMMPALVILNLSDNLFNDSIPISLCKMTSMLRMDLSRNRLSGNLPHCLNDLQKMWVLKSASNRLSGVIPESLGEISSYSG